MCDIVFTKKYFHLNLIFYIFSLIVLKYNIEKKNVYKMIFNKYFFVIKIVYCEKKKLQHFLQKNLFFTQIHCFTFSGIVKKKLAKLKKKIKNYEIFIKI